MKKGVDFALFRRVVVDNNTGKVVRDEMDWIRPAHGIKVLKERAARKRRTKEARRRQQNLTAITRRKRQRKSARA